MGGFKLCVLIDMRITTHVSPSLPSLGFNENEPVSLDISP